MNSPSPSKYPNRDGLPLSQLSPERVNGRVAKIDDMVKASPVAQLSSARRRGEDSLFGPVIPHSPSLPEVSIFTDHIRMNTDVSGLVKRFEHLDVRDRDAESQERRRRHEEALSRAEVAREEAESELAKCREVLRAQKKEYEDCKARERKADRRIDMLVVSGYVGVTCAGTDRARMNRLARKTSGPRKQPCMRKRSEEHERRLSSHLPPR